MEYYHINPNALTMISGPHTVDSAYVRQLTRCGTPYVLPLTDYDLVPEVREPLGPNQKYDDPVITANAVTIPAIDKTDYVLLHRPNYSNNHFRTSRCIIT